MNTTNLKSEMSLIDASPILAEAVNLAYDPARQESRSRWVYSKFITCGDAQARILVSQTGVGVIAIAGTQATSIGDWASNLQVKLKSIGNGAFSVHTGFYKSAEQVAKAVLSESHSFPDCFKDGNYFITGHSLGAATAAILPLYFFLEQDSRISEPLGAVAFGSPHYLVGDCGLLWPCELLHIQSSLDIVSHIPTGFFVREWAKAGQQVFINDAGFSTYPGHEIKRFATYIYRGLTGAWLRNLKGIKEHSMLLYESRTVKALALLKEKQERLADE